jgi:hypothetical protein
VIHLVARKGDAAPMAIIELVDVAPKAPAVPAA